MEKTEILQKDGSALSCSHITPDIIYRLDSFFEFMSPLDFRDNLTELYHNYIMHEHGSLPLNFRQLAESMIVFLDFLKFVDEEYRVTKPEAVGGERQPICL